MTSLRAIGLPNPPNTLVDAPTFLAQSLNGKADSDLIKQVEALVKAVEQGRAAEKALQGLAQQAFVDSAEY